jgi:hypothetical protein
MNLNSFLKEVFTGDTIHDFQHANRAFTSNNYQLAPKYSFLFYVRIIVNPRYSQYPDSRRHDIGVLCKSVGLPKFTIDTKTLNAYNRPNIVQTKIKYEPVTFKFHDDNDDTIREFWYDYYSFYYRDSDYDEMTYANAHKYRNRTATLWGLTNRNREMDMRFPQSDGADNTNYIKSISIFSFHQKRFSETVLINPTITQFQHGDHQMSGNDGIMENSMTVAYETVKYRKGYVTPNNFSDMLLHYDTSPSPLTPAGGGTASILGPGGGVETVGEVIEDLANGNFGAAIFKGGRMLNNFKGKDLGAIAKGELLEVGKDILRGNNPLSRVSVPSISSLASGSGASSGNNLGSTLLAAGGIAATAYAGQQLLKGGGAGTVLAVAAGAYALGKRNQEKNAEAATRAASSNGAAVGKVGNQPTYNTTAEFPATSSYAPPKVYASYARSYTDGLATMNDARDVLPDTDQTNVA